MAQGVGRDVFGDAGGDGVALHQALDAADGEARVHAAFGVVFGAGIVDEERFAGVFAGLEVAVDPVGGLLGDEDGAVFLAFAAHHEFAAVEVDVVDVEADELGYAQAAREEEFDNGTVAEADGI